MVEEFPVFISQANEPKDRRGFGLQVKSGKH
jgi:hypothetical protein